MNVCGLDFVWTNVFNSLGYMPRSRISRSSSNTKFNCLRKCTIVHSHQQCIRVLSSPQFHQHLLLSDFDSSHPVGVKWYLLVILICIP